MNNNKNSTRWTLYLSILLPFVLSACNSGGNSTYGGNTGGDDATDTTAPTVSSTSPENLAASVARDGSLTATFDEDIFANTVDANSFTLARSGAANNTSGSITFDGVNNIANFAPSNPLAILTTYTATLNTAITDLSGNALASDFSWSFTTADGSWGTAELMQTVDVGGNTPAAQIAFDDNGNALAVWSISNGSRNNIWANRFDGTSWGTPELIETNDADSAFAPQIAIDDNGNALVVWYQSDVARFNIWANRFDGTSWGTAELIETDNAGSARVPQIAFDSSGNAIAVWYQSDGTRDNIWANRFDGTSWGTAELIETDNAGRAAGQKIVFDRNGNALAVWYQSDGTRYNIWANRFNGTSWGAAELIETNNAVGSFGAFDPEIAIDNNGSALVVWRQGDGNSGNENIWSNRYDGTSWGTAELIETDDTQSSNTVQIAMDNSGNAFAIWTQYDGSLGDNLWVNRFDGTSWGTSELIEAGSVGGGVDPQISFDNTGNALAVWSRSNNTARIESVWASRFNGTDWSTPELIEADNAEDALNVSVAIDNSGSAFAVWSQDDGNDNISVWSNRFD